MTTTLTIDFDSALVLVSEEEFARVSEYPRTAVRLLAEAMQRVADRHGLDAVVTYDPTSGARRGEDHAMWERLAIDLVDEVRAEVGLSD